MESTTTANEGNVLSQNSQMSNFDWITDKNLLRDEGVYYGLSDSNDVPEEKIKAIRQYFLEKINYVKTAIASKQKELVQNLEEIAKCEQHINDLHAQIMALQTALNFRQHDFWRFLVGLMAYIGMFIFNFWLIYGWLQTSGLNYPVFTAIAVYLFGAFSLFNSLSILYSSDQVPLDKNEMQRERWKTYLEEVMIPFVAAGYLVYKGQNAHPPAECAIFFLLVFSIFLFAGKGLLNILIRLKQEYRILLENRAYRKINKEKIQDTYTKISALKNRIQEVTSNKEIVEREILENEKSLAVVDEQKETHVSLFLSEYELAKSARKSMDNRQVARIISSRR